MKFKYKLQYYNWIKCQAHKFTLFKCSNYAN